MPLTELSQISSSTNCWGVGWHLRKANNPNRNFFLAVLFEDKGKPIHLSALGVYQDYKPTPCRGRGFQFQICVPVGTRQSEDLAGTARADPCRGQVRKRPCTRYVAGPLLKRSEQKAFMSFYIYVVLSIGPGVRWSPRRRSPCLPFGRLSRERRDARSIITRPGSEQPSGIFLSCRNRHQTQGKAARGTAAQPVTLPGSLGAGR